MPDSSTLRILIELVAIVGLLSLNGLFALSEIAVVSVNRTRLQQLAVANRRAKSVLRLAEEPTAFLSTVQIGITLIGILAGALSGATLSTELAGLLDRIGWFVGYTEVISFSVVVVFVTLLSLLIGELIPKSIALSNPERFAMAVAPAMERLAWATAPIVALLTQLTNVALRLLRIKPNEQPPITEEELKALLSEGVQAGVFEPMEEQIVTQALELDDISLKPILTHRTQVAWLDVNDSPQLWLQIIQENPYAAFPLCDGSMDRALGVVRARDLLLSERLQASKPAPTAMVATATVATATVATATVATATVAKNSINEPMTADGPKRVDEPETTNRRGLALGDIVQPALFVPLTVSPSSILTHFHSRETSMVFAVDEYGGVEGIVTQSDILARLTKYTAKSNLVQL